ncbi:uncharacterized protein LOC111289419 [Durio zibethinus]|uniref:RNA-directed DNA polymerase n=1 Tax=Durio zibethinus TaxID=66656 RepID=A0A6P5Y6V7_DURZI|nr:uncharacterized protein LOC111289419 [Durio zibethinus]
MEQEQASRFERIEKAQEELKGDLSVIMAMLKKLDKAKAVEENPSLQEQSPDMVDPVYPPGFEPRLNQPSQGTRLPVPTLGGYPNPYPGITSTPAPGQFQNFVNPIMMEKPSEPILVPDLDDPKEREKLGIQTPEKVEDTSAREKMKLLEERLRAVEGMNFYGSTDAADLCLVPDVVIPTKFKVPEFEKYDGTKCPMTHIIMYCRKMAAYARDEKLLMHIFQDSLTGSAARWYVQLDRTRIHSWQELTKAFLTQYRHVTDMIPDRLSLQSMEKKATENFKEYAQRWRDVAAQVQPPLTEKETTILFVNTLKAPYYERLIGNATKNFTDMVISGEIIESAIKNGKLDVGETSGARKSGAPRKKENEAQAVNFVGQQFRGFTPYSVPVYQTHYPSVNHVTSTPHSYQPYQSLPQPAYSPRFQPSFRTPTYSYNRPVIPTRPDWRPNSGPRAPRNTQEKLTFDPIPMTYTDLYPRLVEKHLLAPVIIEPMKPPFPKWYDPNAHCDYHYGNPGHSTENCTALKRKVQGLINEGVLNFDTSQQGTPNVNGNPLPNHTRPSINALIDGQTSYVKRRIEEVKTPMAKVFEVLVKTDMLKPIEPQNYSEIINSTESCNYHRGVLGHSIQNCHQFRQEVQKLIDEGRMEFYQERGELVKTEVSTIDSKNKFVRRPVTIYYDEKPTSKLEKPVSRPVVTIKVPGPFPYQNDKTVPWKYDYDVVVNPDTANITGVGGITRSGRCYTPEALEKARKEKAKVGEENENQSGLDTTLEKEWQKPVSESEAGEFLKLIKHSEYSVVEQLNKMPARISLLSLLLSSESHRNALLKVLNQAYVSHNASVEYVEQLVGNLTISNYISFSDEEIPPEGRGSTKALHITVKCKSHIMAKVLIDNGSSINVMPVTTLTKLPVDGSYMKPSHMIVRAFDGTRREVLGDIEVPLQIGPCIFNVKFQVMDISPSYSCLLGRPWIHMAGAVPSSLHQKVKFIVEGKLTCVAGEEDLLVTQPINTPYVESADEALECSYRSFEIANATYIAGGSKLYSPYLSTTTKMVVKQLTKMGWRPEAGLGKNLQGITKPSTINEKRDRFGLGYKPTRGDRTRMVNEKRDKRIANLKGYELESEPIVIPHLYDSFHSGGYIYSDLPRASSAGFMEKFSELAIQMVDDGEKKSRSEELFVYPCPSDFELDNWKVMELPVVFKTLEKFENLIHVDELDNEEDSDNYTLPLDLLKLIEHEDKPIEPHQEITESVNLGGGENKREVKVGTSLLPAERQKLEELLREYVDVFAWTYQDMPGLSTDIVEHKLPLKSGCKPMQQKLRRMKPEMLLKIKEEVKKQFDAGFLEVAKYPEWVANIVPVPKKDGKVRMCVDYRDLNRASPKDNFPLPHIDTLVDNTARHSTFSFMDGFSGYNQIKMARDDMEKTTFVTMWGTFCYKVMPFGLKNAGATYQRAMVTLFHDMMHKEIEVYVDDMIAKSREGEDHIVNLKKLFDRLRRFQLKLNPAKCTFGAKSGKLLGFVVSEKGIEVDPDKIQAIQNLSPPHTSKEVRGFLGRLNYIARFISQLTYKCDPIFKLLRKHDPGEWNDECQEAFDKIKEYLSNPPVLMPPMPGKPLILYLTVHENSMGCVLGQRDETDRKERAIYYLSKKFTDYESKYSPLEKMCCALTWTARRLRQYMLYHTTWLIAKLDPIKYVFEKPSLTGRIARWQVMLSEYDIIYVTQKAIKGSAIAEFLADRAVEDYEPMKLDFPDEDVMAIEKNEPVEKSWRMYFDGAANALGHGIGAILISPDGHYYPITARLNFNCTNNVAEYEACVMGLQAAIEKKIKMLDVFGDSALVIYQLRGEWETRDSKLIRYHKYISELVKQFKEVQFEHLPREENQIADALATLAAMIKIDANTEIQPIKLDVKDIPAHCSGVEKEIDGRPWYHDIMQYIKSQQYPEHATENDKRTIRRLAMNFFIDGDILYKRGRDQVLLRCVNAAEAKKIIEEVHDGICGAHANGHMMARQIMRAGYYWLTMESDCIDYARRCHKCQIYADKIHAPPSTLHVLAPPWPFSMWGMDVIGPITPKASNGHRFIFVMIDYFTKWVEAASYASVTRSVVCKFIKREIMCRYGLPETIISDNAKNLNNKMMNEVCTQFKIRHRNSAPYRPKMNGAVEAANKNIKRILEKMTETYKDWHEKLPFALHAYRTSVRTSTGATPFSLVYGMEAVLPIEVEIPSLRVLMEVELEEAEWVRNRYEQLNLIEEKRLSALCHGQLYQKRMMRAHDKKTRPRCFREGDLVLKRFLPNQHDNRGKWTPNWEGPYVVKKAFSGGALILAEMDGGDLPTPINSDVVKKYFA